MWVSGMKPTNRFQTGQKHNFGPFSIILKHLNPNCSNFRNSGGLGKCGYQARYPRIGSKLFKNIILDLFLSFWTILTEKTRFLSFKLAREMWVSLGFERLENSKNNMLTDIIYWRLVCTGLEIARDKLKVGEDLSAERRLELVYTGFENKLKVEKDLVKIGSLRCMQIRKTFVLWLGYRTIGVVRVWTARTEVSGPPGRDCLVVQQIVHISNHNDIWNQLNETKCYDGRWVHFEYVHGSLGSRL